MLTHTQCSLHPESQHTLGLLQPPGRAPKTPTSTNTWPEFERHTQKRRGDATLRVHRHGLTSRPPTWTPAPQPRTHWCACTYALQSQSHTNSLTRAHSEQRWSHIWIPSHIQNSRSSFHTDTIIPPETQSHPVTSDSVWGPWVAQAVLGGREIKLRVRQGKSKAGRKRAGGTSTVPRNEEIDNYSLA